MDDLDIQLGGIVVKPDEVLILTLPADTPSNQCEQVLDVLDAVGLAGRSVIIAADVQLATAPRD